MAGSSKSMSAAGGGAQSPGQLTRAYLEVHEAQKASGGLRPGASKGQIHFQFNPTKLTLGKTAKWESRPASGARTAPPPEFRGSEPAKLSLEMFLDATDTMGTAVVDTVDKLFACCVPTDSSHSRKAPIPPLVIFHWGKVTGFPAYITSVTANYSLFTPEGTPVRATVTVELHEMPAQPGRQNPTSGGLEVRRQHTLVSGESLASIAYQEYGEAAHWRAIADLNGIDDPSRVPPGRMLLLPANEALGGGW